MNHATFDERITIDKPESCCMSSAETESVDTAEPRHPETCDACDFCDDCCVDTDCDSCRAKHLTNDLLCNRRSTVRYFTMCQVRRHNSLDSAWIVAGDTVYNATPVLQRHPGGVESILRKSGGVADCSRDIEFHSRKGKGMFRKLAIGKLRSCQCHQVEETKPWWALW